MNEENKEMLVILLGASVMAFLVGMVVGGRKLPEGFWTAEDLVHRLWEVR